MSLWSKAEALPVAVLVEGSRLSEALGCCEEAVPDRSIFKFLFGNDDTTLSLVADGYRPDADTDQLCRPSWRRARGFSALRKGEPVAGAAPAAGLLDEDAALDQVGDIAKGGVG